MRREISSCEIDGCAVHADGRRDEEEECKK